MKSARLAQAKRSGWPVPRIRLFRGEFRSVGNTVLELFVNTPG